MATSLSDMSDIVDAVTGGHVTPESDSKLAALRLPSHELHQLTNVVRPTTPCCLITVDGTFPPQTGWPQYTFHLTCNRLLTAPALRLECHWTELERPLSAVAEFHFGPLDNKAPGIRNFRVQRDVELGGRIADEIHFTAFGATSQGLHTAEQMRQEMNPTAQQVLRHLRSLTQPGHDPRRIRLRFFGQLQTTDEGFPRLVQYLTGALPLPSLSLRQWSSFMPLKPDREIADIIYAPAPFPMVPITSYDTFSSVTEAVVELFESSRFSHLEQEMALKEWTSVDHYGLLFQFGGVAVMAIRYGPFRTLGSAAGTIKFDLPDRIRVTMRWTDNATGIAYEKAAARCTIPIRLSTSYDALFVMSRVTENLQLTCVDPLRADFRLACNVRFDAKMPCFTLQSQLSTVYDMRNPRSTPWYPILLNQNHASLRAVDLALARTGDVDNTDVHDDVEQAYHWMLKWRKWNAEQLRALQSIRKAVGGMSLITGPAGTGKTLVLQAICVFLYKLGLHVLVLAPANSNCNDFMQRLIDHFGDEVDATRVFPASTDFNPEKLASTYSKASAVPAVAPSPDDKPAVPDTTADNLTELLGFEMIRADQNVSEQKYKQEYGLSAQVLAIARLPKDGRDARDPRYSLQELVGNNRVDVWEQLHKHIVAAESGEFIWNNEDMVQSYRTSYEACKAHYLTLTRLLVTTTGNVRCKDIIDNWSLDRHGQKCKGIVVVIDEACKDKEVDTWSAPLLSEFSKKITGVVMLGDERQLEPANVCSKGGLVFNPFRERVSIPLLSRLKREGFPCVELVEQHRMNHHIAQWPTKNFYPPGMRNGRDTYRLLHKTQPGLFLCLKRILDGLDASIDWRVDDAQLDRIVRTQYLEIDGIRDNTKRSAFVREHVAAFFDKVYWYLRSYFGEKLAENVMIITAYKEARNCWIDTMTCLQRKYSIPDVQMPKILTIDSSQGSEAPVTFLDCSVQSYSPQSKRADIGFVDDDKRMNVAMTRAQEVRWFLGGDCGVRKRLRDRGMVGGVTPAYVRHREEIGGVAGLVTHVQQRKISGDKEWMDRLEKKDVKLEVKFADDHM